MKSQHFCFIVQNVEICIQHVQEERVEESFQNIHLGVLSILCRDFPFRTPLLIDRKTNIISVYILAILYGIHNGCSVVARNHAFNFPMYFIIGECGDGSLIAIFI